MEKYLEDIVCLSDIKVLNVLIHFFKEKKRKKWSKPLNESKVLQFC